MPSAIAAIDVALREADVRRARRIRDAELDHDRETRTLLQLRTDVVMIDRQAGAERLEWLTRAEIAAMPAPGRRTPWTVAALRRAIDRIPDRPEVRRRGTAATYSLAWLVKNRICAPCAPSKPNCAP